MLKVGDKVVVYNYSLSTKFPSEVVTITRITKRRAIYGEALGDYLPPRGRASTPEEIEAAEAYFAKRAEERERESADNDVDHLIYRITKQTCECDWYKVPLERLRQIAAWLDEAEGRAK